MTRPEPVVFREATADLAHAFWGRTPPFSFKGWVATIEDRVVGIGGISFVHGLPVAFSEMKDELRGRKRDLVRCFRHLEAYLAAHKAALWAECSEPTSPLILARLGFQPTKFSLGVHPLMVRP